MDNLIEKIEKTLGIKIENVEEMKGKSFPLFDMVKMHGIKLSLIKNPLFVVIEGDDVYEKRIEGNFIVIETDKGYLLAKYSGEPNIEALRTSNQSAEEPEETDKEAAQEEVNQIEEEVGGEEDYEEQKDEEEGDPVKEIVEKLPSWADGAVVIKREDNVVALPIKKSTKKEGAYYASVSWRPLDVSHLDEDLLNHIVTKSGKKIKANVYIGDKYINIFANRPRGGGYYSKRR